MTNKNRKISCLIIIIYWFLTPVPAQTFDTVQNIIFEPQSSGFVAEFEVTPSDVSLESSIKFMQAENESEEVGTAVSIIFGSNSTIEAWSGKDGYFVSGFEYKADEAYKMRFELSTAGETAYTYNAFIKSTGDIDPPVKVIYDTDMCFDVDDAGALATLHALADLGEVQILGVVFNEVHPDGAAAIDAINTWYGRGHLPVGIYKGSLSSPDVSNYLSHVAKFPNDMPDDLNDVPSALEVYIGNLESQPDHSVTIISVGFLNNLSDLLNNRPDLVEAKVKELVIMAGVQNDGFNLVRHNLEEASENVFTNWPTPIVVSQPGANIYTGSPLEDTPAGNPVREAYYRWFGHFGDRSSWDQITVLYGVRGDAYFNIRSDGTGSFGEYTYNMAKDFRSWITEKLTIDEYENLINDLMVRAPQFSNLQSPWTKIANEYGWIDTLLPLARLKIENPSLQDGLVVENLVISEYTLVSDLSIRGPSLIPVLGGAIQLSVEVFPADAVNQSVIYSVDNNDIAVIDSLTGLLIGISEGVVTVTARARDGSGTSSNMQVEVKDSKADNLPDPKVNLALLQTATLSGSGGARGRPEDILFDPLTGDYSSKTDWNEYGVGYMENLGLIGESEPFFWKVEWVIPKLVNYITLGGCYPNQPQSETMWKVQYLHDSEWFDIDSGKGGWISDGIFEWGGPAQVPLATTSIRFIAYSDGASDLESIHLRARGGVSNETNDSQTLPKATLIQYLGLSNSINSLEEPPFQLLIYPNPVKDYLAIESKVNMRIRLYNLNGSLVYESDQELEKHQIDMSPFAEGIYVLKILSRDMVTARRLVKQ